MAEAPPAVSVIIPAHNAGELLPSCLESVFASAGVSCEVILVNDASTDETERIARSFGCRVISLKSNIMAANCRNLGSRHARGEILVFFDADQGRHTLVIEVDDPEGVDAGGVGCVFY